MKKRVSESTIENMQLLEDISDIILKDLPDELKIGYQAVVQGFKLVNDLKQIYKKYKNTKYRDAIAKVASSNYKFTFAPTSRKSFGHYSHNTNTIVVNIYNIIDSPHKHFMKKIKKKQMLAIPRVKSTLIHELRHLFQYSEYPEFYNKELTTGDYKTSPIELDASFMHILKETDPSTFKLPDMFAKVTMANFMVYKNLTDKQLYHYYKKAINYFYQINKKIENDSIDFAIKTIYDERKFANPKDFVKEVIAGIYGSYFKRSMISNELAKRDYNMITSRALAYYKSKHIGEETVMESIPRTLYHGTLKKNLPSIMKYGVEPRTGKFTQFAYDEYIDAGIELPKLVFAADKRGLENSISAIMGAMRLADIDINIDNFLQHAALIVFKEGEEYFDYRDDDMDDHHYPTVEPNDYYRERNWVPDYILTGKKLLRFLRRNGININRGSYDIIDVSGQKDKYIKNILKANPTIDKTKLKNMSLSDLKSFRF